MTQEQEQFLQKLIECPGPSNYEENVQKLWRSEVSPLVPEITIDPHGNNVATLKGSQNISILIVGHADEIGLIVRYINSDGFIYVSKVGGVDPAILPSHRVRILSSKTGKTVHGVIGRTAPHQSNPDEKEKKITYSDIWIDIGAKDKAEAESLVGIGDVAIYGEGYQRLSGTRATARCFDNRIGIYIVAEVLKNLSKRKQELKATVFGVSSIQEETGVWGAGRAGYALNPTLAIALDVTPSTDSPGISKALWGEVNVSKGAVFNKGIRSNRKITQLFVETAEKHKIPYQIEVDNGHTSTDADPISQQRAGIPIGVLSPATRYLHSSCEILDLDDLDHCVNLLTEFILNLNDKMDFRNGM
ncbi:MAG: M42 family metallopeptidase [Bacteroidota bacterium]|nr:M42 family metallopeptidase [Bacteroidota bacterium]MDP4228783.1 M42 family metallopeptidase [Bacteroidota bacterium]MDP4236895.1 M42 family metallopeptidase [Bacteroidota bacterium]